MKTKKFRIDIPIVFQDDFLLIINKPGGIATNGNRHKTVENLVQSRADKKQKDALPRPVAAHRIDVPTKGLVVLAKTKKALAGMGKLFQQRQVQKTYYAITHGKMKAMGRIDSPVGGKKAITEFVTERAVASRKFGHFSLVKLTPETGRTHQLRIHLQEQGHLIVGDKQYAGEQRTIRGKGLFLCATALAFRHPITGKSVEVAVDLPSRFQRLLDREEERF